MLQASLDLTCVHAHAIPHRPVTLLDGTKHLLHGHALVSALLKEQRFCWQMWCTT